MAKHTLAEKVDRASYTLLGIKLSSSFFFFLLPSCPSRLRGSIILILFGQFNKNCLNFIIAGQVSSFRLGNAFINLIKQPLIDIQVKSERFVRSKHKLNRDR
ncbi:hypothetical protein [Microcoleus sp.]|uniref:hypothetical protein n=1 Tax=Microcoleus sp. TaxID=44472 RepID=UPI00403EA5BC